MRKLKITICAMLLLLSGVVFAACGEDRLMFDATKFTVANTEYTYDGTSHIFSVKYDNKDVDVVYSLDGTNFKSGTELGLKDAGTYKVYYKVSSDGYKDYVSNAVDFIINKLDVTATVQDYYYIIDSDRIDNIHYEVEVTGDGLNESLKQELISTITYNLTGYDGTNEYPGNEFLISINSEYLNSNYNVSIQSGKLFITTEVVVCNSNGTVAGYYSNFVDAVNNADAGSIIKLNADITLDHMIEVDKAIKIDGQGHTINATEDFIGTGSKGNGTSTVSIFDVKIQDPDAYEFILHDVKLDCNRACRGVSASAGKVVISGETEIKNGKKVDNRRSGGVFITNAAQFEMSSGTIVGNDANDTSYTKYCADLWIGANSIGSLAVIDGGYIGSVFVNSNEYSANNPGSFTLNGGLINNLYLEYDSGYGSSFKIENGGVNNLYISTLVCGEAVKVSDMAGQYKGGIVATVTDSNNIVRAYNNIDDIVSTDTDTVTIYVDSAESLKTAYEVADKIVLVRDILNGSEYVGDIVLTADDRDYNFTIDLNGHKIDAELDFINHNRSVTPAVFYEYGINVTIIDSSIDKTGVIGSSKSYAGILLRGNDKININLEGITLRGETFPLYVNGNSQGVNINATDCKFIGCDGAETAAYLAGNGVYEFTRCEFVAQQAYYTKSGNHTLVDCTLQATLETYVPPVHNSNGSCPTGSAMIIDSATGYSSEPELTVTISGGRFISVAGYGIEEISTAPTGVDKVSYATVNIVVEPVFETAKEDVYSENDKVNRPSQAE